jgi:hypothetical protein
MSGELYRFNADNLQDIAAHDGFTVKEECQYLQDNALSQASFRSFAKLQPDALPFLRSAAR